MPFRFRQPAHLRTGRETRRYGRHSDGRIRTCRPCSLAAHGQRAGLWRARTGHGAGPTLPGRDDRPVPGRSDHAPHARVRRDRGSHRAFAFAAAAQHRIPFSEVRRRFCAVSRSQLAGILERDEGIRSRGPFGHDSSQGNYSAPFGRLRSAGRAHWRGQHGRCAWRRAFVRVQYRLRRSPAQLGTEDAPGGQPRAALRGGRRRESGCVRPGASGLECMRLLRAVRNALARWPEPSADKWWHAASWRANSSMRL